MKQLTALSAAWVLACACLSAQNNLDIPFSNHPKADGVMKPGEWDGAGSVDIAILPGKKATVRFLHDKSNLFLAFTGNLESANLRFPEVLIDLHNEKSASWKGNDWWFHVSAMDCENMGAPNVFNDCEIIQSDWQAAPNFVQGAPMTDTVEIKIPFSKIGTDDHEALGIAFVVTNTFSAWNMWPPSADVNKPSTWASAELLPEQSTSVNMTQETDAFRIFPNPASDHFTLEAYLQEADEVVLTVRTICGKIQHTAVFQAPEGHFMTRVNARDWPNGLYLLEWRQNKRQYTKKLLLSR